jgi:hypothetical protein
MNRIALIVALACSWLSGCASNSKFEVRNATNWPLDVEVALPQGSGKSAGGPTQFRTAIAPGGSWSNVGAAPGDRADLHLRRPNGNTLLRVKANGSTTQGFVTYTLDYDLRVIATVREDDGGAFDVVVAVNERPIYPAKKAGEDYFE